MISKMAFGVRDKEMLENELLEKVWKCMLRYDPERHASFPTFVNICLKNHILAVLRGEQGKQKQMYLISNISNDETPTDMDDLPETRRCFFSDIDDQVINNTEINRVCELLPTICQDILRMRLEGYTFPEISDFLGEKNILVKGMWNQVIKPLFAEELKANEC